jgi:NDP-sugar pyrophosphorylase family protein
MRVVILAGGKGVRLAPLTEVIPKPLVPIGGMPILEFILRQLGNQGFTRITLAVGYLAELIRAYFGDGSRYGVHITYSYESEPLGTAGPLSLVEGLNEPFIVMNADVMTNIDYNKLLQFHQSHGGVATISAHEIKVKIDLGVIIRDGNSRITDYVEKPTTEHLVSMGIYVFEPQVLSFIKKSRYLDFPDLIKILLRHGLPVHHYHFKGFWLDIGRHEDYAQANNAFKTFLEDSCLMSNIPKQAAF